MRKFKKIMTVGLATLMVVSVTGCTGGKEDTPVQASNGKEQVTLRFMWWGGDARHKATLAAIDRYMEINPHVKIEAEYGGYDGYQQKVITQLSGGTAPDIIQLDRPWLPDLVAQGDLFADFRTLIDVDISTFDEKFLEDYCSIGGTLLSLPAGINSDTLIYNKDLFAEFGIPEDIQWTWDSIMEYGKKVNEQDPETHLLNTDTGILLTMLKAYMEQISGKEQWVNKDYTLGFDRETYVAGMQFIKDLLDNKVIEPFQQFTLFDGKTPQENPNYLNKKQIMAYSYSAMVGNFKVDDTFNMGTMRPPLNEDRAVEHITGIHLKPSMIYTINNASKHKEEAAKFTNWLLNDPEAAVILTDVRSIPGSQVAMDTLVEKDLIDPVIVESVNIGLENSCIPPNNISSNAELDNWLKQAVQKVGFGEATPEEAADELIRLAEKTLAELKAKNE